MAGPDFKQNISDSKGHAPPSDICSSDEMISNDFFRNNTYRREHRYRRILFTARLNVL